MPTPIQYVDITSGVDGAGKAISGASKANPCVVTCTSHGFSNGAQIYIYGVVGMVQLNNIRYTIANVSTHTFELQGVDSTLYTTWSSAGTATKYGTTTDPFKSVNAAVVLGAAIGQDIRMAKTAAYTTVTSTFGWTENSVTVTTSTDCTASIAIGNFIGKPTATGNGGQETFYRVAAINATTITLENVYCGDTASTASCYKLNPVVTGAAGTTAITIPASTTLSGGWNLATEIQDGETWMQPNGLRTAVAVIRISYGNNNYISKINMVDAYYALNGAPTTATAEYCSVFAYHRCVLAITRANYCCVFSATQQALYANYPILADHCMVGGAIGSYISATSAPSTYTDCVFAGGTTGMLSGAGLSIASFINCTFKNLQIGSWARSNLLFDGCTFSNCITGISSTIQNAGVLINNCDFTNCTTGIFSSRSHGFIITESSFTSCGKGIYLDADSGDYTIINCSFTTPSNFGISREASSGLTTFVGCTIDGASVAKAYRITASAYLLKQYVMTNSFGITSGSIWGNGSCIQDWNVYRTSPPSTAIAWVTTSTTSGLDIKVVSAYVNASATRTFTFYTKASDNAWSGSVIVKWKLNGALIKTEVTPITSMTTNWTQLSYSCDSSLITTDGELSLEFNPNTNNYSIYVDDAVVS